jgi:hypothetical protein
MGTVRFPGMISSSPVFLTLLFVAAASLFKGETLVLPRGNVRFVKRAMFDLIATKRGGIGFTFCGLSVM